MLGTFVITAAVFGLAILGLAAGVILSNKKLQGTCGGLNSMQGEESACSVCQNANKCETRQEAMAAQHEEPVAAGIDD